MRKSPFIRLIALMMAVLLLVSSTGLVIVDHVCLMRGKTQSVWTGQETCSKSCKSSNAVDIPEHGNATHLDKVPCCQEKAQLVKLEVQSKTSWAPEPIFKAIIPFPEFTCFLQYYSSLPTTCWIIYPDTGPPAYPVAHVLALLCTWTI
ncbi:MAG: hypothetical protein KKG00_00010 [Bacteroidetes bacterium]|nr:hypothetical protein [Bacteroidota bacterium]